MGENRHPELIRLSSVLSRIARAHSDEIERIGGRNRTCECKAVIESDHTDFRAGIQDALLLSDRVRSITALIQSRPYSERRWELANSWTAAAASFRERTWVMRRG